MRASPSSLRTRLRRSSSQDPQSPDTLDLRLGIAEFLAKSEGGDCRRRLDNAKNQLDAARASQAVIALPFALAREASVDYQIHLGRASCDGNTVSRDQELRAAVESADHAVSLYRDEFDAVSMVTMQFNVGATYHELGDDTAAAAALQSRSNDGSRIRFSRRCDRQFFGPCCNGTVSRPMGPDGGRCADEGLSEKTLDEPLISDGSIAKRT